MTISTTTRRVSYAGDASTVTFAVPFAFFLVTDLRAYKRNSAGSETALTISSYTGGNGSTGTVTLSAAVGTGNTLFIERETPKTQETDYTPNDPFPAQTHERALDKLTMLVQDIAEDVGRAIVAPPSDNMALISLELPKAADRADKVLAFDEDGNVTTATQDPGSANAAGIDWADGNGNTNSIESKLRQVVSVVDFGAVGDYVKATYTGTDNSTAFTNAVAAATSAGVALYVPAGSYYLSQRVLVTCDIYGPGEICIDHKTALYNPGYGGGFASVAAGLVLNATGVRADGLRFWSPGRHKYDPALAGAVNGGMYAHILLQGSVGTPSEGQSVTNCRFFGGHFASVLIGSNVLNCMIRGNIFEGNGYQVLYDDGTSTFKANGSSGFQICDNQFFAEDWTADATAWATTNQAWGGDPIEINAPRNGTTNVIITGNQISNIYSSTDSGGIAIGLAKVREFVVANNSVDYCHHDGIHVEDDSYAGLVDGNRVYQANQGTGGGHITCEKSYGISFTNNRLGGIFSINGGMSYAGPWIPNTSEHVLIQGNYLNSSLFVINQSNVTVRNNEVHRLTAGAPSAGQDGIQITVGTATASAGMQNIIVEGNRVTNWYRNIAVTGNASSTISNFRVRNNYCPPNASSGAPAADKSVYIATAYAATWEAANNDEFGQMPALRRYDGVVEANVVGVRGDICVNATGGYSQIAWIKRSTDYGTSEWLPLGHLGFFILDRTDGTAITGWSRHIRYRGTGGHTFSIALAAETGRLITFENNGSGSPINITPASGTIIGISSLPVYPGKSVTICDTANGDWKILHIGGITTGWATPTGTLTRTTFDPATVTLSQLGERVAALITDLKINLTLKS